MTDETFETLLINSTGTVAVAYDRDAAVAILDPGEQRLLESRFSTTLFAPYRIIEYFRDRAVGTKRDDWVDPEPAPRKVRLWIRNLDSPRSVEHRTIPGLGFFWITKGLDFYVDIPIDSERAVYKALEIKRYTDYETIPPFKGYLSPREVVGDVWIDRDEDELHAIAEALEKEEADAK